MRPLDLLTDCQALLDEANRLLCAQKIGDAMRLLTQPLAEFRDATLRYGVHRRFVELVRCHEVLPVLLEDPFTHRAYYKPRGYPGDAVLLDLLHSGRIPNDTSELGRNIFTMMRRTPGAASLLFRCELLRKYIDDAVAERADCRILAIGSGHCRELSGSAVLLKRARARFVALDPDPWACRTVARHYPQAGVRARPLHILELLENSADLGSFDLIYSACLFDYTTAEMSRRLTAALMRMLRRDGRLLVGNFMPRCESRGYMDTVMDWPLHYRDPAELQAIIDGHADGGVRTFVDPFQNVVYAEAFA